MHGVRLDEPVCHLTELHQAAARVEHIQLVHAPRRFDDLTHIEALGQICVQRMNVVHTDVAGGVLGDVFVRAKPEVDLDVLADGDAVVVVAKVVRFETELWKKSSEVAISSEASTGMARSNMDVLSGIGHFPSFRRVAGARVTTLRRCEPGLSCCSRALDANRRGNVLIPFDSEGIIRLSVGYSRLHPFSLSALGRRGCRLVVGLSR